MKQRSRTILLLAVASAIGFFCRASSAQLQPKIEARITVAHGGGYFPVLIRLKNGRLLVVYRYGAPHISVEGKLAVSWSDDGGRNWSKPLIVAAGKDDHRNPAMVELANGDILLAYCVMDGYDASGRKFRATVNGVDPRTAKPLWIIRSRDHGTTWSAPEEVHGMQALIQRGEMLNCFGKMTTASDGSVVMSVYSTPRDHHTSFEHIFRSIDSGRTWSDVSTVAQDVNETAVLALPGNRVVAALRTNKEQQLLLTHSSDGGNTWSTPKAVTRSNEHPGDLIRLSNGDILLTSGERNAPRGAIALLSHDHGDTWGAQTRMVLADDAPLFDCGYPSSVELPDGRIITVYYKVDDAATAPDSATLNAIVWRLPTQSGH